MITATGLELRAGARILLSDTNLRVQPGDRIGLVGRNGAGKTTTLKVLAGEGTPHAGAVERRGPVGYLPQDPRTGDLEVTARDRVLSARGLDTLLAEMKALEERLGADERLIRRYGALEDQFAGLGGYAAEAEAARICANLGLPDRVLAQTIGTLSGGQRRRIELARILFRDAAATGGGILLLDEPTNHLDADSITWLRGFLSGHKGGLVVISHDVELLDAVVNKVWYLDANRATIDFVQPGLEGVPASSARPTSGAARRERANAEKKAGALMAQADKMRAKATKTIAAQNMARRAERMLAGLEEVRVSRQGGEGALPQPDAVRQDPADRARAVQVVRLARDLHATSTWPSTAAPGWRSSASTAPARPRCCGCWPASCTPDTGEVHAGARPAARLLRAGARDARRRPHHPGAHALGRARTRPTPSCARSSARSCSPATTSTSRPGCSPAGRRPGSRWPRWSAPAPTCCCSTSRPTTSTRSAGSRCSTRSRGTPARSCWSPTTRARCTALKPDRAILLPDGVEDAWSDDLLELVELA